LWTAALMTLINVVMGTLTAYVLVSFKFPGKGLLNALLDLPSSEMRSVGYKTVIYSTRADDGDHIVWYQRKSKPMVSDNTH
jgi:sulfate transport system permease protein